MNAIEIKEYLLNDIKKLEDLLWDIGLSNVIKKGNEIRCAISEGRNPTAIRVKLNENLTYTNYSEDNMGDIYGLVGYKLGFDNFKESFKYVCGFLNISGTYQKKEKPIIFGGAFSKYKKNKSEDIDYSMKTYPIEILNDYELIGNELFQRDGIDLKTQMKYHIGYDWNTHRITIPEFNCEGELVGVTGRYNGDNYKENDEPKYYPIIEFQKSKILFGYSQNYHELQGSNLWLVESQKSVMRMDSIGKRNFLALGGKALSPLQVKYIQNLNPKSIIVALDEGVKEEVSRKLCELLKPKSSFLQYKIGYIYDENNEYLKEGSKDSPADLELEELKKLSKKVRWYNG